MTSNLHLYFEATYDSPGITICHNVLYITTVCMSIAIIVKGKLIDF